MTRKISKEAFLNAFHRANGDYDLIKDIIRIEELKDISLRTFFRYKSIYLDTCTTAEESKPIAGGTVQTPEKYRGGLQGKTFVFTSAQNNTYVHKPFFNNLIKYCNTNGAELVVSTFTYNTHSYEKCTDDYNSINGLWYSPEIIPFVKNEALELIDAHEGLVFCGELDIRPTAEAPLSGLDSYTGSKSSIIPHAKVQAKTVHTMKYEPPKFVYTTGCCTLRNYIPKKTGQKAAFHHVYGALVVEIDEDGLFFARYLLADEDGNFYDLDVYYEEGRTSYCERVEAINYGDIHAEVVDHKALRACIAMRDALRPRYQFLQDITDFRPRNHHSITDPHQNAEKYHTGKDNVHTALYETLSVLNDFLTPNALTVVVESNHDLAFAKWLKNPLGQFDAPNAELWHKYNYELHKAITKGVDFRPFVEAMYDMFLEFKGKTKDELDSNLLFLKEDESFKICNETGNGVECGMHGHLGLSGSRGSPMQFRKVGFKSTSGHTHGGILIIDGVYVAGCNCLLDLGYNKGLSNWTHTDVITYANGKRTPITKKNGKWRA